MNKLRLSKKEKFIYIFIFLIYTVLNFILVLKHEPWRDEIHAWLMSKTYSISELFIESRFDGHPILWHLILMPFAKLNFPIITLNIINYIIILVSVYFLLFKTRLSILFKLIILFTIPFTYTYSAIARNYSLILLFLVLISVLYPKRFEKPILYSILICFLIHTHSLAWGIVAGLTITFHFAEIYKSIKYKNVPNIKKIIVGLILIVANTIIVVFELYGTTNSNYTLVITNYVIYVISIITLMLLSYLISSLWIKKYWKEYFVILVGLGFQVIIYTTFYSSILYQRFILIFVLALFYLLLLASAGLEKKKLDIICIIYLFFICLFGIKPFMQNLVSDIKYDYSSAQEMAEYINNNLPENETVLIDVSVIGQSILPYLDSANLYDVSYGALVDCANVAHDNKKVNEALKDITKYSGNYLIICNNYIKISPDYAELIFETSNSVINEHYTLYYIN